MNAGNAEITAANPDSAYHRVLAPGSPVSLRGPLVLIGMRGAGKSHLARVLAPRLHRLWVDLDGRTVDWGKHAGRTETTAGELLAAAGEVAFRGFEAAALRTLLEPTPAVVVAAGGGVLEREDNRTWLRRTAFTVWLDVPADVLQERLRADADGRPSLTGGDPIEEVPRVLARRREAYREAADLVLECGREEPSALADRLIGELAARVAHREPK